MPRPTRRPVDKTRIEVSTPSLPSGRRSSDSCLDQFINARFRRHPLGDYRGDGLKLKTVFCPLPYRFADEDRGPVLLVQTLKASRQVHAVPECCIIHTFRRPHFSYHRLSGMNAKANGEWRQSFGLELGIKGVARRFGGKGGATGPLDVIGLRMGRVP